MSDAIDWSKGAAWVKGEVVPIAEATIGVTDWGLTRSDIAYDVVAVWEGAFFRLDDHLDRFEASMASLRMDVGVSREESARHCMPWWRARDCANPMSPWLPAGACR